MKLNNYIKTKDKETINDFIKLCKDRNIPFEEEEDDSDKVYGVGIFARDPGALSGDYITESIKDIDFAVCLITDNTDVASWWNKLNLNEYQKFIKDFDKKEFVNFINKKLNKAKENFPQFTIGCEMISTIDLEYGFYKKEFSPRGFEPYILKGYCYSSVCNEFGPRTDKGYGDFEGFRIWNKDILDMDKKQIKKLIKEK